MFRPLTDEEVRSTVHLSIRNLDLLKARKDRDKAIVAGWFAADERERQESMQLEEIAHLEVAWLCRIKADLELKKLSEQNAKRAKAFEIKVKRPRGRPVTSHVKPVDIVVAPKSPKQSMVEILEEILG